MIRKILCILFVVFASGSLFAQNGAIKGKILDAETGEAIPFANIVVEQNGNQIGGGVSDFDGYYTVKPVPAGRFTVKASYVGYNTMQINDVIVYNDKIRFLDLKLNSSTQEIEEIDVVAYTVPLIDKDNTTTGGTVTSEEISKMAGRSAESVASTVGGVYQEDGEVKSVRGAREDATVYYIDGVKVRGGKSLPKSSIAEVSVVTGGVPAKYGDATGGIISIVTKGASRTYFGGFEFATSKFLDPYENTIAGANISGPILKRKIVDPDNPENVREEPLLGFFAAGEFDYALDPSPSAVGFYKVKDDVLAEIIENPLYAVGNAEAGTPTAETLTMDDFEKQDVRENAARTNASISGKIDFQPVRNVVLTLGGNYSYSNGNYYNDNYYFTSSGHNLSGPGHSGMLNYNNNRLVTRNTYRTYLRLTHRIGAGSDEESASIIKNAYYQIQADYSKDNYLRQDEKHKDNFFDYGYSGKFTSYKAPSYTKYLVYDSVSGETGYALENFYDTLVVYEPSDINPELSNYASWYFDYYGEQQNKDMVQGRNGMWPSDIHNLVTPPGVPEKYFVKWDNDMFRFTASGAADISDHEISLGFEFEKRTDRYFAVEPEKLWLLANSYANAHILELDKAHPELGTITDENGNEIFNDTISYSRLYNASRQTKFDISFREANNLDVKGTDWIDIDSYDPDKFKLDYFSADELLSYNPSSTIVSYYGYDAWGNKLKSSDYPTFEEFFTDEYETGGKQWKSRNIAPFEPIYMAGYIQDKFAFNDLIFNIGVRVDRYDANQMVRKDPYLIYTAHTVGENYGLIANTNVPKNISDDAVVYVDKEVNPQNILGYRMGHDWYDADGNELNNPASLEVDGSVIPYFTSNQNNIGSKSFLDAFEDYKPELVVMPRISFSFPISDEALFFAHYDILTIRPNSLRSQINLVDLLYIEQLGNSYFANPSLTSEKTIDYEFGFQQKLNNKSSLKLSAFYREQRDMVQATQFTGAYPQNLKTFANVDFGTVKGFTATYDLRRTGNVQFKASYTLQFANATGSDATTAANLINAGQPNLRTTLPTDFDSRHTLSMILDYRFASGKNYNGPKWFGKDILADAGANFTINAGAGTPYTIEDLNDGTVVGSINGSNKPWRSTVAMKVDKSFTLKLGKGENAKNADLNVYLDVSNLFNKLNIYEVYGTTGNADDDAYLSSSKGRGSLNNATNPESLVAYYNMMTKNAANYSLPRQIRLGLLFSF